MVIGHGDIASILPERDDLLFFASGVSNSREERESEYQREKDLLMSQDHAKHIVYFSSLCVFYANTRYAKHKMEMEQLVQENFPLYTIIRIGNITWGKNPNTLINYFKRAIDGQIPFTVEETYRYIVGQKEFLHWINMIPKWSCEMNIPGEMMIVGDIVNKIRLKGF